MISITYNSICTEKMLKDYGFSKNNNLYKISKPLYENNGIPLIILSLVVDMNNQYVGYDIIDQNTKLLYFAFYDQTQNNQNVVLHKVENKLQEILRDMDQKNILKVNEV